MTMNLERSTRFADIGAFHDEQLLDEALPLALVAEDDPDLCETLELLLSSSGYRVASVDDGADLLAYLEAARRHPEWVRWPDVVITDIRMPRASGIQVLEWLREADWSTPVILISGFATDETADEAGRLGAALLRKPFSLRDLRERVMVAAPPGA
jgi:DNA-binding response OmpR family regulator